MKATVIILSLLLFVSNVVGAQTLEEWTEQKKTQIKYLVEQITALKAYADVVEKGYMVAKDGLSAIGNIKKGDYNLHQDYFNSLKTVNPKVRSYWKVGRTLSLHTQLVQVFHRYQQQATQKVWLTPGETKYCSEVFHQLLEGGDELLDQLLTILTDGSLQLKDDERLKRIDVLYAGMEDRYAFARGFKSSMDWLILQRSRECNNLSGVQKLYGLHD